MCIPPFEVNKTSDRLIKEIELSFKKFESFINKKENASIKEDNLIKSIWASCAIEGNSLSLNEVREIINGKIVNANEREIIEIKNAYEAYKLAKKLDPFDENSILKIHKY